jgi:hypothetical protein
MRKLKRTLPSTEINIDLDFKHNDEWITLMVVLDIIDIDYCFEPAVYYGDNAHPDYEDISYNVSKMYIDEGYTEDKTLMEEKGIEWGDIEEAIDWGDIDKRVIESLHDDYW